MGSLPPPSSPLLPELTSTSLIASWKEYERALASLPGGPEERVKMLHGLLADVSARLEEQSRDRISRTLQDYASEQDRPVLRSTTREPRSPSERPPDSERSRQPSPLELLSKTDRLGPRLAAKLLAASARRSPAR